MKFAYVSVGFLAFLGLLCPRETSGQNAGGQGLTGRDSSFRVITTAVPFLTISPDARRAALGDAGVASTPDANSAYWNPAQLVFVDRPYGGSLSFTPWLGKIINDMWIAYLSGYYKFENEQAVAMSLKYFDLGDIFLTEDGIYGTNYSPRELCIDVTYSRLLTKNLSLGLAGRYINSNLTGTFSSNSVEARPGNSAAADIGIYYSKPLKGNSTLVLGATITNIGAKLTYSDNNNRDFLPTNLRMGSALTTQLDPYNSLTFLLDFNKLMVPSPPVYQRSNGQIQHDPDGNPIILRGKDPHRSFLSGIFGSFGDAPDGFSEEIQEIMTSIGAEYWYKDIFAGRMGYFLESANKGNRKYMTLGLGFRKNQFGIDMAYLVPTNKREHPLAETLRFSILLHSPASTSNEESVTDPN